MGDLLTYMKAVDQQLEELRRQYVTADRTKKDSDIIQLDLIYGGGVSLITNKLGMTYTNRLLLVFKYEKTKSIIRRMGECFRSNLVQIWI